MRDLLSTREIEALRAVHKGQLLTPYWSEILILEKHGLVHLVPYPMMLDPGEAYWDVTAEGRTLLDKEPAAGAAGVE